MFSNCFFENLNLYEIVWKYIVELGGPDNMAHAPCMLDT